MEVIKRQISFEPHTVRTTDGTIPYGTMTANTFYVKVMLTQNMDDMGMYTDITFTPEDKNSNAPDYTILINKLSSSGYTFPFMSGQLPPTPTELIDTTNIRVTGKDLDDYWVYGGLKITGSTSSKITDVRSYDNTQEYITGFDIKKETYTNYQGNTVNGRNRVTNLSGVTAANTAHFAALTGTTYTATTYVFDANDDVNIGTSNQSSGLLYKDFELLNKPVTDEFGFTYNAPLTEFEFTGEGWNDTNTSLSALTKEEYLFGITQPPEVQSDVFIDRGATTVLEKHLRFSEVESLEHLERYNNGFYRLVKQ